MKKSILWVMNILLSILLLSLPGSPQGKIQLNPDKQLLEKKIGLTDPVEFGAFIDGIMTAHMQTKHIAGATFALVKDGEIFFGRGYGYADVEKQKPVVADETLFRPGSVSKLFTWTAVMQLVEQGKLDLNQDINTYGHLSRKTHAGQGPPAMKTHFLL